MQYVDLHFSVVGDSLPANHGYPLYAALSRIVAILHDGASPIRIGPIRGDAARQGVLRLNPQSRLRIRLPADQIPVLLTLAGKSLDVAGHRLRLGVPSVRSLIPAPALAARMVTIKHSDRADHARTRDYMEPPAFLEAIARELSRLGIRGEPAIPLVREGPHAGKPRRQVLRIKDRRIIGYALIVEGLTAEESILMQEQGLGGRKKMGCGFFVGMVPRR